MSPSLLEKVLKGPTDNERVIALAEYVGVKHFDSRDPDVLFELCSLVRANGLNPELRLGAYLLALQVAGVSAIEWPYPPYEFNEIDNLIDQSFIARWGFRQSLPRAPES